MNIFVGCTGRRIGAWSVRHAEPAPGGRCSHVAEIPPDTARRVHRPLHRLWLYRQEVKFCEIDSAGVRRHTHSDRTGFMGAVKPFPHSIWDFPSTPRKHNR